MTAEGLATRAEIVLDARLAEVWQLLWGRGSEGDGTVPEDLLAALLRLAYLQGYADASAEPLVGDLYRELGVRVPPTAGAAARPRAARRARRSSGR